jgi:hypothetical protein
VFQELKWLQRKMRDLETGGESASARKRKTWFSYQDPSEKKKPNVMANRNFILKNFKSQEGI